MKLPELKKSEQKILKLGGYELPFKRFKVSDFANIASNKQFQAISKKSSDQAIVYILALLLDTEDTFQQKLEWLQNVELEDITELYGVANALGVNEKKISQASTPSEKPKP